MTWLPGLAVLAVGLVAGLLMARRLQGGKRAAGKELELRIADLEARRDDLYRRLREIDEGDGPEEDRTPLERAAARTLRELDRLQGELVRRHPKLARKQKRAGKVAAGVEAPAAPAAVAARSQARLFITGFAYGAGLLILVGALIYWAVRDAQPRPDDAGPMAAPPASDTPHPEAGDLPPEIADRVAAIASRLESAPDDLDARKDLGYTYLGAGRFVEAFRQGEEILARRPEDPDGLYLTAIVRLTMGQWQDADQLLARALATDPEHVDSLTATGIIRLQLGDYEQAIAIWKRGLAAVGGANPMIERLIRLAEEGRPPEEILGLDAAAASEPPVERQPTAEEILGLDPARAAEPPPAPAPATPAAANPAPAAAPAADVITIRLELAPGATATPGSILFVMLRGAAGGPPVAVKRIGDPRFPMTLTLGQDDSMMGAPVPETGTVTARLDVDGSASTRGDGDLEASAEAGLGEAITLRLTSGS